MNGSDCLDGFDLNNNFALDNYVGPKAHFETNISVYDWNTLLPYDLQAPPPQFVSHYGLVHGFEKSRSQSRVDFIGCVYDLFRNLVFCHLSFASSLRLCAFARGLPLRLQYPRLEFADFRVERGSLQRPD